nr:Mg chelatase-like protein [Pseudomonas avellanae]
MKISSASQIAKFCVHIDICGVVQMLKEVRILSSTDERWLETACERLTLSLRSAHRLLKVARTLADLEQVDAITRSHLAEALQYRPSSN